jgi:prevent-host-death family protein
MKIDRDTAPVSEFRAHTAELIEQVRNSGRPLVLTEHGQSAAVLLDVVAYERMIEEIDLLTDVRTAVAQLEAGQGVSNEDAQAELRRRFAR